MVAIEKKNVQSQTENKSNENNTHDWKNDKPYEGDLSILNGKKGFLMSQFVLCYLFVGYMFAQKLFSN